MFGKKSEDFSYTVEDGYDYIIEESGNSSCNLRRIKFGDGKDWKLDLRKYFITETGERMGKGYVFMTEEGPHNLVDTMTKLGYGNTYNILQNIKGREDFHRTLNTALGKESEFYDESAGEGSDEFYDPKSMLF